MEKGFGKKAQFFLLAAVVIAAIVINLGIVANQARTTKEPKGFSEYSFSVKTEAGAVIDFEIISNIDDNTNLTDFVEKFSKDLKDKDPDLQFILIYGNKDNLTIENYGNKDIIAGTFGTPEEIIEGAGFKIKSKLKIGGTVIDITNPLLETELNPQKGKWKLIIDNLSPNDEVNLTIDDAEYSFKVSKQKQFIIILYKEGDDEKYIAK